MVAGVPLKPLYIALMRRLIRKHATNGLACSREAAVALYGDHWQTDPRFSVVPNGIDLTRFRASFGDVDVRKSLGIPPDAIVFGHVGRFDPQKNHHFLVRVIEQLIRREPRVYGLLVGEGQLQKEIEALVREAGIGSNLIFAGRRADVAQLMMDAMDVFLFPSQSEALPLALIEAQSAGLPCLISENITREVDCISALVARLSLEEGPHEWCRSNSIMNPIPP